MANEDYFSQDLSNFNPYYAPYYDDQNKNSKNKNSKDKSSKKSKKEQKNSNGKGLLRRAEDSSLFPNSSQNSWQNNVQGKAPVIPGPKGIKITGKSKGKAIVLGIIIALIFGGGVFLSSTNALLPGAISALFTEQTNSAYAGYILRSVVLQSYSLTTGDATTGIGIFKRYKNMSTSFIKRLAANNITVDGTGSNKVLKWTQVDANGNTIRTVDIDAREFKNYYMNNAEFRSDYSSAQRSRIATFFDPNANTSYANQKHYSRNEWKDYEQTGNSKTDTENYETKMKSQFDSNDSATTVRGKTTKQEQVFNDDGTPVYRDGEPVYRDVEVMDNENLGNNKTNSSSIAEAESNTLSHIGSIAQKAAVGANGACALLRVGSAISLMMSALEKADATRYFLNGAENVSKTIAGEGQKAAINEFLNNFTTPVVTSVPQFNKGISVSGIDWSAAEPTASSDATTTVQTEDITGAPIQAQGVQVILGGRKNVTNDVANYSAERITSPIAKALGMSNGSIMGCLGVQAGAAVISIAVTIASFGTYALVDIALDVIKNVAISVAAQAILKFAVPTIAKYLYTNIFETVTGVAAGELFAYGAAATNFGTGQYASGQIPASKESVLEYNKSAQQVAALDAEVDRLNLSPLDISSPNTFLGSIAYNTVLPIISSTGGLTSTIGNLLRTTSTSISNIIGSAHATGEGSSFTTIFGNSQGSCPKKEEQGYACTVYGQTIPVTPLLNVLPDDPGYVEFVNDNIKYDDATDTYEVIENSYLAMFTIASIKRESDYGVEDTNILGACGVGDPITSSIPIIGDLVDIYDAAKQAVCVDWANGLNASDIDANNKVDANGKSYRTQALYASVFTADQRILDTMSSNSAGDAAYQNPITAFINKYEAEHPVDNSFTGYLSRITGLPKETTETVIAMVDYYLFLKDYDPSTRIAMIEENTTVQPADAIIAKLNNSRLNLSDDSDIEEDIFLTKQAEQYIIYADIRNRSYAA